MNAFLLAPSRHLERKRGGAFEEGLRVQPSARHSGAFGVSVEIAWKRTQGMTDEEFEEIFGRAACRRVRGPNAPSVELR